MQVSPTSGQRVDDAGKPEDKKGPMAWASVGLMLGLAGNSAASMSLARFDLDIEGGVEPRRGFYMSIPVRLGGDKFAFLIQPMLQMSKVNYRKRDSYGNDYGVRQGNVTGVGAYLGPDYYARVSQSVYVGGGLGIKALYSSNETFDYAGEFYLRAPIHVTYYAKPSLGVIGEFGFGYGASLFAQAPQPTFDPYSGDIGLDTGDPNFGLGWTWDLSIGVALP